MQKDGADDNGSEYGLYEIGFLIVPAADAGHSMSAITEILGKHSAVTKASEGPAMRDLSYEITKTSQGKIDRFNTAYFGSVVFEAGTSVISDIKTDVEKVPDILRFILIETAPEALMPRERRVTGRIEPEKFRPEKPATPPTPISEAELDKTIESLVVE